MSEIRVAYFMSEFPRRTDTFVQREVQALRDLGAEVDTYSLRRPGDDVMVGPEQVAHRAATTYLLDAGALGVARALVSQLARPRRFVSALRLAADLARPGARGALYQTFYVAEALLLAAELRRAGHEHLHAHYGDVSSTIALIAARLAGVRFSFTLHGPGVFFEAHSWHLGRKVDEADFVACISWFCRSQAQLLASPDAAAHLHVIHCGIDPDRYRSSPRPENGFHVGTVGRLEHVKGSTVLLQAFAALRETIPGAHLSFVGDGPDRRAARRRDRSARPDRFGHVPRGPLATGGRRAARLVRRVRAPELRRGRAGRAHGGAGQRAPRRRHPGRRRERTRDRRNHRIDRRPR